MKSSMKSSIFGMLFILILLTIGPLIYFNGGDRYVDKWLQRPQKKPQLELNRDVVYAPVTTDEKVKVFKWKDENGVWQFGSTPPPGQQGVETMTLQPNVNIMKSIEVPEKEEVSGGSRLVRLNDTEEKRKIGKDDDPFGISQDALENPYAPDSVSELLDTTKNLQGVLDSRQQLQQSIGKK